MPMGRNRIVFASWYDYPQYYDILFQDFTQHEADFIEAACRKYCPFAVRRLLEPACGTGRLITELATRGYELIGFDISQPGLRYLRRQLARFRLYAEIFEAEMSDFRIGQPADAAYCVINTFRYLLTEQTARGHLECLACSLRPGGIYILGLHLLPLGGYKEDSDCWTQRRSKTEVSVTARLLRPDRRRRIEDVQLCLVTRTGSKNCACSTPFSCARTRQGNFDGCWIRFRRWNCATSTISGTTLHNRSRRTMKWLTAFLCYAADAILVEPKGGLTLTWRISHISYMTQDTVPKPPPPGPRPEPTPGPPPGPPPRP